MARTNKYTSLNFNDFFEKKIFNPNNSTSTTTTPSSASSRSPSSTALPHKSYSLSASSRLGHGGMLVLSRSSPKPQPQPQTKQPQQNASNSVDFLAITSPKPSKPLDSDSTVSLRPQGKTGGSPSFQDRENNNKVVDVPSSKCNKFVPPHLRPGFVAREVPDFQKPRHAPAQLTDHLIGMQTMAGPSLVVGTIVLMDMQTMGGLSLGLWV